MEVKKKISENLIHAVDYAKELGCSILGIVGKSNGYVSKMGDIVIVVPNVNDLLITPHSESFQAVIWHSLVSHPDLQTNKTTW